MILTVGHTKGGVGKSTLALNIAVARTLAGRDVWLIDGDRQGSSLIAATKRADSAEVLPIACAQYTDGAALLQQVKRSADKYQDVIIDVGGRDSTAFRGALSITHALLIPIAPRSVDVWSLDDVAGLVKEAQAIRGEFPVYTILNNADATGSDNQGAIDAIASYPVMRYIDAPIKRRKSIAMAYGNGLSVFEWRPTDAKAVEEINRLVQLIYTQK